jgi:hypothetical protein
MRGLLQELARWLWRLRHPKYVVQAGELESPRTWRGWGALALSLRVQRTETQAFQCLKAEDGCPTVPLPFYLSILGLRGLNDACPHWWEQIFFSQSAGSKANLFWKHPHEHPQKCFTHYLNILNSVKLTSKINHRTIHLSAEEKIDFSSWILRFHSRTSGLIALDLWKG